MEKIYFTFHLAQTHNCGMPKYFRTLATSIFGMFLPFLDFNSSCRYKATQKIG